MPASMWSASNPYSTHVPASSNSVESFAHRELAERVLPLDEIGTAHAERAVLARFQVSDERTPVVHVITGRLHARLTTCRSVLRLTCRLRCRLTQRPFHSGERFSANAATPSAESSVSVVTVNMPCRYESASSAFISSTR